MEESASIEEFFDCVQRREVNALRLILRRLDSRRADCLLKSRNPEEEWQTALMLAVIVKDESTVRLLLQEGADISHGIKEGTGSTCLLTASKIDSPPNILNSLLACEKDSINIPNEVGWTPLIQACISGDEAVVAKLLREPGIKITHTDCWGRDAKFYADNMNRRKILQLLRIRLGEEVVH